MKTEQKSSFHWSFFWQAWVFFFVGAVIGSWSGIRLVLTPSVPIGLYREVAGPVYRGGYAVICLPLHLATEAKARGYIRWGLCEGWAAPLVKVVAAVPGDTIEVGPFAIFVNGEPIENSAPLSEDSQGRPLAHALWGKFTVQPGEVWLVSSHAANSLDSRYWGAISERYIWSAAVPLWTEE